MMGEAWVLWGARKKTGDHVMSVSEKSLSRQRGGRVKWSMGVRWVRTSPGASGVLNPLKHGYCVVPSEGECTFVDLVFGQMFRPPACISRI